MLTNDTIREMMVKSIENAKKSVCEVGKHSPKVGAVLINKDGKILEECYRGETGEGNHCEFGLIQKARKKNIDFTDSILFVTLEPCVSRGKGKTPCAQRIVECGIKRIYIGMLDPNPIISGKGELFLRDQEVVVERYPHDLIMQLREINEDFVQQHRSSYLPNDSLFMSKNISQIIVEYLNKHGYTIDAPLPNEWNLTLDYITVYCKKNLGEENIEKVLNEALGYAYDSKYLTHTYQNDVRGVYTQWRYIFEDILRNELNVNLNKLKTIVVGIGNGHEGKYLYSDVEDLTIVDIAPKSLKAAKKILKHAKSFVLNAQELTGIESNSMDAYISLLTYQSTYFDINKALIEAYRILKDDGIIILSVACGFMKTNNVYIDGLIDPVTGALNRHKPLDIVNVIRNILLDYRFISLGIKTSPSEIFVYARKNLNEN